MGLSSSKQTQKSTPVYEGQITGAADAISNTYNSTLPKVQQMADQLGSLTPSLLSRYTSGDSGVNAARDYNTRVLGGEYLGANPWLDSIVSSSNDAARNAVTASLGTRGLTGGSTMADLVSRNVAANTANLYGQNYEAERSRMAQAAGMAPTLSAAQEIPLSSLLQIAGAQMAPLQAATAAGSGIGGLLGGYTNQVGKGSPSIMQMISAMAASATKQAGG